MISIFEYIPYTLLLFVVIALAENSILRKKLKINIIIIVVALFSGLRYNVGKDYMSYYEAVLHPHLYADRFEFVFRNLCYITEGLPWLFMLITAFAVNFIIIKSIEKYSGKYGFSILAYLCMPFLFLDFMCVIRFGIAVSIMLFAFLKYNTDRRKLHFLILWFVAINCHITALICILFLIPFEKLSNKVHLIALVVSLFVGQYVMQYMNNSAIVAEINQYYARYLINENAVEGQKMLMLYMIFATLNMLALYRHDNDSMGKRPLLSAINVGFCLLFVFSYNLGFAGRVSRYFSILMIMAIPYYKIPLLNIKQSIKILSIALVLLFYVELFIAQSSFYTTKSKSYMPYQTILLKD